jgi:hypothetical protein
MGLLPAGDGPGTGRPTRQVDQVGDLGHPGAQRWSAPSEETAGTQ